MLFATDEDENTFGGPGKIDGLARKAVDNHALDAAGDFALLLGAGDFICSRYFVAGGFVTGNGSTLAAADALAGLLGASAVGSVA